MYNGNNKTALASQRQIAAAFTALLREKPYSQISVSAICKEAGVSRQTFYSLFSSKENIVLYVLHKRHTFHPGRTSDSDSAAGSGSSCMSCGTDSASDAPDSAAGGSSCMSHGTDSASDAPDSAAGSSSCPASGSCHQLSLKELSFEYARYIKDRTEFLSLLDRNNLLYLMHESLYGCFFGCTCFCPRIKGTDRCFVAEFVAGSLSGIAKTYVRQGSTMTVDNLEAMIYSLFSGDFFSD